jgi:ABC-type dipeptide/oligopeptide/nickel transport system permease subunit
LEGLIVTGNPRVPGTVRAGAWLIGLLILAILFGPLLAPRDPTGTDLANRLRAPDLSYPLGTDSLGRCVFSRLLYGTRASLGGSLLASSLALGLGVLLGLGSALGNRWFRGPLKGLIDVFLAFPGLVLALVIIGALGPSWGALVLGLAVSGWAWYARLIRSLVLSAEGKEFVRGGRALGVRGLRLLRRYLLPQLGPPLMVAVSLRLGWMVLGMAGLSYLGLGPQPPHPEWGAMLQESRIYFLRAPWLMIGPGLALTLTVLGFNLLAEGLRDALDLRGIDGW